MKNTARKPVVTRTFLFTEVSLVYANMAEHTFNKETFAIVGKYKSETYEQRKKLITALKKEYPVIQGEPSINKVEYVEKTYSMPLQEFMKLAKKIENKKGD